MRRRWKKTFLHTFPIWASKETWESKVKPRLWIDGDGMMEELPTVREDGECLVFVDEK